jgi:hypothetical protein
MIIWDDPDKRYYQHGLDRGVLYKRDVDPVPWNGLISFDENNNGVTEMMYRDGVLYLADADPGDFSASLTSMMYPDSFGECIGIPKAADGLYVDNQKPQRFNLSYRTLIGSGTRGDMFGYQIHLVYNCMATIGQRQRRTLGGETAPAVFTFDIGCTPVKLQGFRPTAHYVIDTRGMSASIIAELEGILYGVGSTAGRMPTPTELYDMMNFGAGIVVRVDNLNDTYTVTASSDNLEELTPDSFIMRNINGTDNGDGTYVISDGGTTDVIIET